MVLMRLVNGIGKIYKYMKILFVCSGNSGGISPIIKNQGQSLEVLGHDVDYFAIEGKGVFGYLNNVKLLKKHLRINSYDIIHAHYSLSAFVASLAGVKSLFVSLMGSDVKASIVYKYMIILFANLFSWKRIIVKSRDMYEELGIMDAVIIPNGVDTDRFKPLDQDTCRDSLKWKRSVKHILFTSNPDRKEKNYLLAKKSVELIHEHNIELHFLKNVPNEQVPIWYNAADVVLLTSLWEGSPNAIKEAMACNRPIVSTNVGDVEWLFSGVDGCFISSFLPNVCKSLICQALTCDNSKGLDKLYSIGLTNHNIASRIIAEYLFEK